MTTRSGLISWPKALAWSMGAVYGPFVLTALYALGFVSCSHCKQAAWSLLPCAPGLIPMEFSSRLLDLPRFGNGLGFVVAFLLTMAVIGGLARLVRMGTGVRYASAGIVFGLTAVAAYCTLSMIRA